MAKRSNAIVLREAPARPIGSSTILERGGPPENKGGQHPENGVYRNRGRDEPPYRPVSPSAGRGELFALKARFKLPYRSAIPATQEPREGLVSQRRSVFHVSGLPCYLQSTAWRPNCSLWRPCLGRAVVRVGAGKGALAAIPVSTPTQGAWAPVGAVQPNGHRPRRDGRPATEKAEGCLASLHAYENRKRRLRR